MYYFAMTLVFKATNNYAIELVNNVLLRHININAVIFVLLRLSGHRDVCAVTYGTMYACNDNCKPDIYAMVLVET